jgi:hypothetical protein
VNDDIDWSEEVADYDANAALTEARSMWLRLGRAFKANVEAAEDYLLDEGEPSKVMAFAARAEACFWRATGDAEAIDAPAFIPELAKPERKP